MNFGAFFVPVMVVPFIAWVAITWIRAKHGYPIEDGAGRPVHRSLSPDAVADQVRQALASRDATIAKLEERVRVLERIVTDDRYELKQQFKDLAR